MKSLKSGIRSLGFVQSENEEQLKGVFIVTVPYPHPHPFLRLGDGGWYTQKGALTMQDS